MFELLNQNLYFYFYFCSKKKTEKKAAYFINPTRGNSVFLHTNRPKIHTCTKRTYTHALMYREM